MCGAPKDEHEALGVDHLLRPGGMAATAATAISSNGGGGGGGGGASSRFRVDGRITRPARGDPWSPAGGSGGAPMCAAVLKDLRRRLKEAELEARAMRAERAAVDKRDRLVSGTAAVVGR